MNYPILRSDGSLIKYLHEINRFPILSKEEEFECAKKVYEEGDIEAAKILITSHLRFVVKVAAQFKNYGLPMNDLVSEGTIGLMQAVKKFNPYKGFRLATYATWWIKAMIQEYILRSWSLVKIGTTSAQKTLFFNLRKIKSKILGFNRNNLELEDIKTISSALHVSEQEVKDMDMRLQAKDGSLNTRLSDEDDSVEIIDTLPSNENLQDVLIDTKRSNEKVMLRLHNAFQTLNERERDIITSRKCKENQATLEELSEKYSISRERVRQIESKAIEKIKKIMLADSAS